MGLSMVLVPSNAAAFRGLPRPSVPYATSLLTVLLRVGGSLGVAARRGGAAEARRRGAAGDDAARSRSSVLHGGAGEAAATVAPAFGVTAAVLLALTVMTSCRRGGCRAGRSESP